MDIGPRLYVRVCMCVFCLLRMSEGKHWYAELYCFICKIIFHSAHDWNTNGTYQIALSIDFLLLLSSSSSLLFCRSLALTHYSLFEIGHAVILCRFFMICYCLLKNIIFTQAIVGPWLHQQSTNRPNVCLFIDSVTHLVKYFGNRTNASHRGQWLLVFSFLIHTLPLADRKWDESIAQI